MYYLGMAAIPNLAHTTILREEALLSHNWQTSFLPVKALNRY